MPPLPPSDQGSWQPPVADAPSAEAPAAVPVEPVVPLGGHRQTGNWTVRLSVLLVAVVAGAALFLGGYTLGSYTASTPGTPAGADSQFAGFWDVYHLILDRFAGATRPTPQQLQQAAIDGMMKSLNDRFSVYQPPEDFKNSTLSVGGQAEGIGVIVQLQPKATAPPSTECSKIGGDCELAIVRPISGSPAAKAGLQAGDVIAAAGGTSLDGLTVDDATSKIKGPRKTPVTLTILRAGKTLTITIVRDVYDQPEVDTKTIANGQVEYIDIAGINPPASSQFDTALKAALAAGRRSFVVDLRGNGGGTVADAVKIASEFIPDGILAYQVDASGKQTAVNATPGGAATDPSIKVVVLVDKNTASAAEILSGALQGRRRAQLVGQPTFGKGLVQEWLPLPDDLGGIHLTIARWLTPAKVWITPDKPLQPDVVASSDGARAGTDPVLDAGLTALGLAPSSSSSPSLSPSPSGATSPAPATPSPLPSPS